MRHVRALKDRCVTVCIATRIGSDSFILQYSSFFVLFALTMLLCVETGKNGVQSAHPA